MAGTFQCVFSCCRTSHLSKENNMEVWLKSLVENGQFVQLLSFFSWCWRLDLNIYSPLRSISLLTSTEMSEFISSSFLIVTCLFPQPILYGELNLLLLFMCLRPRQQNLLTCVGVLLVLVLGFFPPSPASGQCENFGEDSINPSSFIFWRK